MTIQNFIRKLFADLPARFTLVIVSAVAASLMEGLGVALLVPLLSLASGETQTAQGTGRVVILTQKFFTLLGLSLTIRNALILIFLISITQQALIVIQQRLYYGTLYRFMTDIRSRLYKAIFDAGWPFFLKHKVGNLTNALATEVDRAGIAFQQLCHLIASYSVMLVYLVLAALISVKMTAATMAIGIVLVMVLRKRLLRGTQYGTDISQANTDLYSEATEQISGAKLIKGGATENSTNSQFNKYLHNLAQNYFKSNLNEIWLKAFYELSAIGVLCLGIYTAIAHFHMPVTNLIVLLFIFYRLVPRLSNSQGFIHSLLACLPSFDRIAKLQADAVAMREESGDRQIKDLNRGINLQDLSFNYNSDMTTLRGINLRIAAGKTTAIVGGSGAGKSTIVDLIMGLLVPGEGTVLVDDVDLKTIDLMSWRHLIGYVAQDTILFHTTVKTNISWGLPVATDAEIIAAAKTAYADDFINQLPDGYDTVIGDRGVRLSGGQRQRLALARALARKPKLLILDEATSALDAESERKIQKAVESLAATMTIVIVTHRLATVQHADLIYVLENGKLVESGTWDQLQRAGGRLHALKQLQALD